MTDPVLFALAVIALLATPGPTNTLLLTAGATAGSRPWKLIPAEIIGYAIAVLTIGHVIAPLASNMPMFSMGLRVLAACYLVMIAIRLWRHSTNESAGTRLIEARHVFFTTLFNPKALLFGLGIVPIHDANAIAYFAAFCLMIGAVGGCWISAGIAIRKGFLARTHAAVVPRIGAAVIGAFAGYLVLMPLI